MLALGRIEILSVSLLDCQRPLVEEMRQISEELNISLGWHYLLDLSWAAQQLDPSPGMLVMDAGAGVGAMQWWLAKQGIDVLSVDRLVRRNLDSRFRSWCPVKGLRPGDLQPLSRPGLRGVLPRLCPRLWLRGRRRVHSAFSTGATTQRIAPAFYGTVTIYNQALTELPDIADASVDAVISISALEHNKLDALRDIVKELMRVLKPGGRLIVTLAGAKDDDWFHEPSKGWCYTEATLREIFDLPADCPSNFDRYDELFDALRNCDELRDNLADVYFESGDNGMPWGIWNPTYQPLGIVKLKDTSCSEAQLTT